MTHSTLEPHTQKKDHIPRLSQDSLNQYNRPFTPVLLFFWNPFFDSELRLHPIPRRGICPAASPPSQAIVDRGTDSLLYYSQPTCCRRPFLCPAGAFSYPCYRFCDGSHFGRSCRPQTEGHFRSCRQPNRRNDRPDFFIGRLFFPGPRGWRFQNGPLRPGLVSSGKAPYGTQTRSM